MNRLPGAASRTLISSAALAVLLTLFLAGCSGDEKPAPAKPSGSSGGTSAPAGPKDESAAVLGWATPAPVAKTQGKLGARPAPGPATVPATAEIISVQAGDTSTILTWQLSSATDIPVQGLTLNSLGGARSWPDAVRLVDLTGKKSYSVNTMQVDRQTFCVCTAYPIHVGPDPVRMTAEYPPLPTTVTAVTVQIPNFAPVSVPVTR